MKKAHETGTPASAEPQSRHSVGARRNPASAEAILDAATAILAQDGLGGFSIEAVARAARAGKPTIYRWWPNRTSLVLAAYQRQKDTLLDIDSGNVFDDCVHAVESLIAHWRDTPAGQIFRAVIAEAQSDPVASQVYRAFIAERQDATAEIFRRGIARGELRPDIDPLLAMELLAGFARERLLTDHLDTSHDEIVQVVTQLLNGLRA